MTTELQDRGLTAANPLDYVYDVNPSFGGPIRQDKLWFFSSFRQWGNREQVTGLYRPSIFARPFTLPIRTIRRTTGRGCVHTASV